MSSDGMPVKPQNGPRTIVGQNRDRPDARADLGRECPVRGSIVRNRLGTRREVGRLVTSKQRIWRCQTPLEVPLPISRRDTNLIYQLPVHPALRLPPHSPGQLNRHERTVSRDWGFVRYPINEAVRGPDSSPSAHVTRAMNRWNPGIPGIPSSAVLPFPFSYEVPVFKEARP
jgi:hypothetical protein